MKKPTLLLVFSLICLFSFAQKKGKGKDLKKNPPHTDYLNVNVDGLQPTPDTANKFTGVIKYKMTTDDPADKDSMIIIFGVDQMRIIMFTPGYKEDQIFENHMIANFKDSTLYTLDTRNKTYKIEKFEDRNKGTEFSLVNDKKTAPILKFVCTELSGDMKTKDEDFQAAALVSKQHSYLYAMDYNFLNIQPVVIGYRIVLGWRTRTSENENTYVIAYEIKPGDVSNYFDLTGYKVK